VVWWWKLSGYEGGFKFVKLSCLSRRSLRAAEAEAGQGRLEQIAGGWMTLVHRLDWKGRGLGKLAGSDPGRAGRECRGWACRGPLRVFFGAIIIGQME